MATGLSFWSLLSECLLALPVPVPSVLVPVLQYQLQYRSARTDSTSTSTISSSASIVSTSTSVKLCRCAIDKQTFARSVYFFFIQGELSCLIHIWWSQNWGLWRKMKFGNKIPQGSTLEKSQPQGSRRCWDGPSSFSAQFSRSAEYLYVFQQFWHHL